jgi:flagellum-specific peptidoglycan hydrolase FlgJ
MKKIVVAILSFLFYTAVSAQTISVEEYIATYKDVAIREMKRSGIPASITLAQGILETENGNSDLVRRSNNHFGIKCKSNWTGASVFHDDDAAGECFRKYDAAEDSYKDHSNFLRSSSRYAFLFDLDPSDYKGWAYGLKKAGYATNPRYPDILIKNIEQNNLHQYDLLESDGSVVVQAPVLKPANDEKKAVDISTSNEMNTAKNIESIKAGKTRFNGLKAVFAPKGTSLLAIATVFDIPLSTLMEFNDLTTDGLLKDEQWVFLEKKLKQGNRDFYVTEQGETLYDISQTNAIQLESLRQFNNINEHVIIKKGTKIRLRPDTTAKQETKTGALDKKIHEVQAKEGLYAISKKYNVSVQDIKEWNSLTADDLWVGQQLIISK